MDLASVEPVPLPCDLEGFDEIIDVRSPSEFAEDHLPGARNFPVLDDAQRREVGTLYNENPFAGRRLGAALISRQAASLIEGELSTRPKGWTPLVYCWRGGMRSRSLTVILRSIGWRARVLEGGYKAWRKHVTSELARLAGDPRLDLHILCGLTGSAKTRILTSLAEAGAQTLDLEGLANHRGSLLGSMGPQPTQKHFENRLYQALSSLDLDQPIFAEAESNRIGNVHLPAAYWKRLPATHTYLISLPVAERTKYLLEDYPHLVERQEELTALLDKLRPLRGNDQVDDWQHQIADGRWQEFVTSILLNHYDLAYRRPGSEGCVYQEPAITVDLPDASPSSMTRAAHELISHAGTS